MKRFFALFTALVLTLLLSANAFAFDGEFVADDADLLTDYEEAQLEELILSLNDLHSINIVIHTTEDTNGLYIEDYADYCYDTGGYREDGLIFVISMAERDYYTSTCGYLVDSLPAYDIDSICEPVVPYLSNAQYYEAFEMYLKRLDSYLSGDFSYDYDDEGIFAGDYYEDHYTNDEYYYEDDYIYTSGSSSITDSVFAREIILIIVAVIIAVVITMFLKSKMNTAVKKYDADDYVVQGSFNLETSRDAFVGSHTTRRALPKNNNTGSRPGGGGGGVRVSSGGVRHGGSGGKF